MKKARWIVQRNLLAENDLNQIKKACEKHDVEYFDTLVIPFTRELPKFPISDKYENIYYGSTTFMNNLYGQLKPKGLFYNENFSMINYINQWGDRMLNSDAASMNIEDFLYSENYEDDEMIFIRPDGDGKEFDGQVVKYSTAKNFIQRHLEYDSNITLASEIIVSPPYNVNKEWRCIIVNGKVVASSLYRMNFKLCKSVEVPKSVIHFAEERAKEYQPHDVFAMDIALVNDDGVPTYFIIECGCANSVGFYLCDINKYVKSLSDFIEK